MLTLRGSITHSLPWSSPKILTLTTNRDLPRVLRSGYGLISDGNTTEDGFAAQFVRASTDEIETQRQDDAANTVWLDDRYAYLTEGDIVRIDPHDSHISCLFRKNSDHNTILLTEQCNHYCLMCSQPPKNVDDSWLMEEALALIRLIPRSTKSLGFSGGEPTLYGNRFVELLRVTKNYLPSTSVDVLTNGRLFANRAFARDVARVQHPDCLFGIPIYSDDPVTHNYVVQSAGAYDETLRGILNLKRYGQKVEIRVVLHKQTLPRLLRTCEFIARNLIFVDHVALMGLEITGFTRANLDSLWIDPSEYRDVLSDAVAILRSYGVNTSVYNHQLCVVNADIAPAYRKSISDWKNEYLPVCDGCSRKAECGGFFSSSKRYRHSDYIKPFGGAGY